MSRCHPPVQVVLDSPADVPAMDHALFDRMVAAALGSALAADTLVQAAAVAAVVRQGREGESMEARRAVFDRIIEINGPSQALFLAVPRGSA